MMVNKTAVLLPFYHHPWQFSHQSVVGRPCLSPWSVGLRSCTAWNRVSSYEECHTAPGQSRSADATQSCRRPRCACRDCWCWYTGSHGHDIKTLVYSPSQITSSPWMVMRSWLIQANFWVFLGDFDQQSWSDWPSLWCAIKVH